MVRRQNRCRELLRIVPVAVARVHDVRLDDRRPVELVQLPARVQLHRLRAPAPRQPRRRIAVRQHQVERRPPDVLRDRPHVILHAEIVRLARLRRHIRDVDLHRLRLLERDPQLRHQQIRQHARVEAARPDHDHIGVANRVDRVRVGRRLLRLQTQLLNLLLGRSDLRLAANHLALAGQRRQADVLQRRGQNPPAHRQDAARLADRLLHPPRNARHRHDEQIAERVPLKPLARTLREAVLEQPRHQRLRVGQRRNAVAQIARRNHPQIAPQPPRRPPVVRHRHDRRDVVAVLLQPAQQHRQPRAPAQTDDARAAPRKAVAVNQLDQRLIAIAVARAARRRHRVRSELPHAHPHAEQRHPDQHRAPRRVGQKLQRDVVEGVRQRRRHIQLAQQERHAQPQQPRAHEQQQEPALHAESGDQPLANAAIRQM